MISGGWRWRYCVTLRGMSFPEEPFTLRHMAPRRRRTGLVVGIAAGALLVIVTGGLAAYAMRPASTNAAGQASTPAPTAASSATDAQPSPNATTASATAAADDPDGRAACTQIIKASADDQYDPAKMKPIGVQAAKSSQFSIRIGGNLLADRADLAKAAKGGENEFSTSLNMATAAMNLATDCYKAGYGKP